MEAFYSVSAAGVLNMQCGWTKSASRPLNCRLFKALSCLLSTESFASSGIHCLAECVLTGHAMIELARPVHVLEYLGQYFSFYLLTCRGRNFLVSGEQI